MASVTVTSKLQAVSEKNIEQTSALAAENRFDLLKSFALTSLIVMLIIGGITGILFSTYLSESLIRRDAEVSEAFLRSLTEVEGGPEMFQIEPGIVTSGDESSYDLPELAEHIATMPGVVRTNIYSTDGEVIWSTQNGLVGRKFSENDELEQALLGHVVFELKNIQAEQKAEYADFGVGVSRLVENYLPIKDRNGAVVAVVEIYKTPRLLFEEMESARNLVWISVATATLFLYASLFWIIYRASKLIRFQQSRLVESETLAAVGEMASAVAHSIRNPLAAIRSGAELTTETSDDPVVRETSEEIMTQIDRIELWLRELLVFSRPEATAQFKAAHLDEIIRLCLQGHQQFILSSNVKVVCDIGGDIPAVKGDAAMLGQMFNSILDNALEAMPCGGTLTVKVACSSEGKNIEVQISDTGYGIPRERLDTMFESSLTTKQYGLGIGMLLVKRIVDRHQGKISLRSQVGSGTTAICSFPRV